VHHHHVEKYPVYKKIEVPVVKEVKVPFTVHVPVKGEKMQRQVEACRFS
jgi:hypothetical protein